MTTASPSIAPAPNIPAIPEWIRLYKFFFKYAPSDEDSETWAKEIRASIHNLRPGEVSNAIRSIGERTNTQTRKDSPAGYEIITEIRRLRREENNNVATTPNEVTYYRQNVVCKTTMLDLKKILENRPNPERAWDIICTPVDVAQCHELHSYCDIHGIEYERFIPDSEYNLKELVEHVTATPF